MNKVSIKIHTGVNSEELLTFSYWSHTKVSTLLGKVIRHPQLKLYGEEWLGLSYKDTKLDRWVWLRLSKRVSQHAIKRLTTLKLGVQIYPKCISGTFCSRTKIIFYHAIHTAILAEEFCTGKPVDKNEDELVIKLAALSAQIQHGVWNRPIESQVLCTNKETDYLYQYQLLPTRIVQTYSLQWKSQVFDLHKEHVKMSQGQAINEYIALAQTLPMYGISYFEAFRRWDKATKMPCYVGIHANGIGIFSVSNRRTPTSSYSWDQVVQTSCLKKRKNMRYRFVLQIVESRIEFNVDSRKLCKQMVMLSQVYKSHSP